VSVNQTAEIQLKIEKKKKNIHARGHNNKKVKTFDKLNHPKRAMCIIYDQNTKGQKGYDV
jgi:hypothetical protein